MSAGCIRCGADGRHVMFPLELVACAPCMTEWTREPTCAVEAVEAVVGKFDGTDYAAHCKRFDAELLKRTQAWAKGATS